MRRDGNEYLLLGHGLSDPLPRGLPYNFVNYCYGIEYAVKAAQLDKFTLIGHSMGGNVAGLYASLFPEKIEKLVLLDAAGMPFIRQDWRGHVRQSIEKTIKTDSQSPRPNPVYSRDALIERIQGAMGMINSSLSPHAIDAWFERGATEVENGQFRINRDFRLGLPSPPIMGYDQMAELHQTLIDADFDILHLRPRDPEKFVGGFDDVSKFRTQTEAFVRFVKFTDSNGNTIIASQSRNPAAKWAKSREITTSSLININQLLLQSTSSLLIRILHNFHF